MTRNNLTNFYQQLIDTIAVDLGYQNVRDYSRYAPNTDQELGRISTRRLSPDQEIEELISILSINKEDKIPGSYNDEQKYNILLSIINKINNADKAIKSLNLRDVRWLTDDKLAEILKLCPDLEGLSIAKCPKLSGFPVLRGDKIKKINASTNDWVDDAKLSELFMLYPNLEELICDRCPNILHIIIPDNTAIRKVDFKYTRALDIKIGNNCNIGEIDASCSRLGSVDILANSNIEKFNIYGSAVQKLTIENGCVVKDLNLAVHRSVLAENERLVKVVIGNNCKIEGLNLFDRRQITLNKIPHGLKRLQLSKLAQLNDDLLIKFLAENPDIEKISIAECEKLTGLPITDGSKIKKLDLANSDWLTDKKLAEILRLCPNLEGLDIGECKKLTGLNLSLNRKIKTLDLHNTNFPIDVASIFSSHPDLEVLGVNGCSRLATDVIVPENSKLQYFDVGYGPIKNLTIGNGCEIRELHASNCNKLKKFTISKNSKIGSISLGRLGGASGCSSLTNLTIENNCQIGYLDISGCGNLTTLTIPADSEVRKLYTHHSDYVPFKNLVIEKGCKVGGIKIENDIDDEDLLQNSQDIKKALDLPNSVKITISTPLPSPNPSAIAGQVVASSSDKCVVM